MSSWVIVVLVLLAAMSGLIVGAWLYVYYVILEGRSGLPPCMRFNLEPGLDPYSDLETDLRAIRPRFTPQWSPDGSYIVFAIEHWASDLQPGIEVFAAAVDGSSLWPTREYRRVHHSVEINHSPSISPDGSQFIYSTYVNQERATGLSDNDLNYFGIEIVTLDESYVQRLTGHDGMDISPVWSPDGVRIAFIRHSDPDRCGRVFTSVGIYTMMADGSDVHKIVSSRSANELTLAGGFEWLPDGRLAFMDLQKDGQGVEERAIYTAGADGSDRTRVSTIPPKHSSISNLAWSPQGQSVAFLSRVDGRRKLYTMGIDGTGLREVLDASGASGKKDSVSWSPDGSQILFSLGETMHVVNTDGSNHRSIGRGHSGVWSPDGSQILFSLGETMHVVNIDGSNHRNIGRGHSGVWSPDGSRVASTIFTPDRSYAVLYTMAPDGSDVRVLARRGDDGVLEAVGPGQTHSAVLYPCPAGVVPDPEAKPVLVRDCEALVEMIVLHPVRGLNWAAGTPITEWEGVALDAPMLRNEGPSAGEQLAPLRVRGLSLPNRGLRGAFPFKVTELTGLWSLDLSGNGLAGPILPELGRLANLKTLNLSGNRRLSGPIPSELGGLTSLQELNLSLTGLSGSIPPDLGDLSALERLNISGSSLSGSIPPELDSLRSLRELNLSFTGLSGSIPPELGSLTGLRVLNLRDTGLSGSIPPELGSLSALEQLDLSFTGLSGSIPPELGSLSALKQLNLSFTDLSGSIPPELGSLSALEFLDIGFTDISGCIPPELRGKVGGYREPEHCNQ